MLKKILKNVKNQKGEAKLTFVFTMLFFFWMVLFMIDIFRITNVYLDAVNVARRVTEVVAEQGGVSKDVPANYPSPSTYINSRKMKDYVYDTMTKNGIENGDITITNVTKNESIVLNSDDDSIVIDYGDELRVDLRYGFEFESMPDKIDRDMVFKITRVSGSKYKNRDSEWEGEEIDDITK